MSKKNKKAYRIGDRQCFNCNDDLPAFSGYAHLTYRCNKDACEEAWRKKFTQHRRMKTVCENEVRCQAPGCENYAPAGIHMVRKNHFYCSSTCAHNYYASQNVVAKCLYCGGEIRDVASHTSRQFCSREHRRLHYTENTFHERAGVFAEILHEYLDGAAANNYKLSTWGCARTHLLQFLSFLQGKGISELRAVKPKTVTAFIGHERARGTAADNYIGHISTFFHWLESEGRVDHSPVIPSIHRVKKSECAPRPLSDDQIETYWRLLEPDERLQIKAALAIGEESGLRIGEVCNLRLADVDLDKQTIHVRLPNKSDKPRDVPFSDKTVRYVREWLEQRDSLCPTDHLLHSMVLTPYRSSTLNRMFQSRLKIRNGSPVAFSFHALRHTWASRLINAGIEPAVLMELGGWQSWEAMKHYVKVLQTTIDRSYRLALDNMRKQKEEAPEQVCSLAEFAYTSAVSALSRAA